MKKECNRYLDQFTDIAWHRGLLVAHVNEIPEIPEYHQEHGWWWLTKGHPDNMRTDDGGRVGTREKAIARAKMSLAKRGIHPIWENGQTQDEKA